VQFRFDFPPAKDASNFLRESPYVKITPEIRQRAMQIASGYATDMEKAVAIAEWVHNNVRYDRNYISIVKASDAVFLERAGTCDEFSHLFIAMLRAVGIPAKFSASFVYGGDEWGPHAFVEAAIDGSWIPFDPTFNEAVILDATHIKFGEGLDQSDIIEEITTHGIDADPSKLKLSREFEVKFKETQNFPELFVLSLSLPENDVGEGSMETIKATIKNKQHRLAVPLSLNVPQEVKIIGENRFKEDRLVLLEPYGEKTVEWKIILPKLEGGYDYKFPLALESLGQELNGTIRASTGGDVSEKEDLKVVGISAEERGKALELAVAIKNIGNVKSEGTVSLEADGGISQQKPFSILPGAEFAPVFTIIPNGGEAVLLKGIIILETKALKITQPFEFGFGASAQPSFAKPSASAQPTEELQPSGIPSEYFALMIAIALIIAAFLLKSAVA
jgi:hypothetical protein